ncbi:glycosyltransferase family 4 protein [Cellulophaga tyrosinoxydans]|uniref:Glycosyltransferase involved in cell wall bisynthesis n=1 Tax=Cellulophaga tyrosinoxydans TaxID=504486 RepID=A0A1W1ZVA9_9FLAO|nr:glycosyltransferase family 4 protein [Cellulophaga tyrosinoxydans]SMC52370.1 Glycosyltransferase involved in cell wall bisynthesis [Cellulophaga tyrosinoxydans]
MKKVLIITYYWPPAGGPGVQRWLKFVKYLRDFNIEPVLYIPENPNYPITDTCFINEIPDGISIYKQPIFEPYKLASFLSSKKTKRISSGIIQSKNQSTLEKVMLWIRGNIFIPDARKFWVKPSVSFLSELIIKEKIETIITTGPPHSVHLIGLKLKEKLDINWISDFRDPWTSIGYHKKLKLTKASQKKHKHLEKSVLTSADKIIVTSASTKAEFQEITTKPIVVITNGFDNDLKSKVVLDTNFTIAHIGSLLTGRNPENLWKVLAELIESNVKFQNSFKLKLVGVTSADVLNTIYSYGLENYVELQGYVSHNEALEIQNKSQVLLLTEINSKETTGIIPGKLFEYLAAKRPILAIGPKNWDVGDIIDETKSGKLFDYSEDSSLKEIILEWFQAFQSKKLESNSVNIAKYSRRELTKKLAEIL